MPSACLAKVSQNRGLISASWRPSKIVFGIFIGSKASQISFRSTIRDAARPHDRGTLVERYPQPFVFKRGVSFCQRNIHL